MTKSSLEEQGDDSRQANLRAKLRELTSERSRVSTFDRG